MARAGWTDQSWVIVLGGERNEFALLADKVHEVITLRTDQVLDWQGSATGVGRQFVRGVTEGALIVLDGAALLQDDRLFIDQGGDGAGA
jgi:chemotaxis signal transduction protein